MITFLASVLATLAVTAVVFRRGTTSWGHFLVAAFWGAAAVVDVLTGRIRSRGCFPEITGWQALALVGVLAVCCLVLVIRGVQLTGQRNGSEEEKDGANQPSQPIAGKPGSG